MQVPDKVAFAVSLRDGHVTVKPLLGPTEELRTRVPAKFSLLVRFTVIRPSGPPRLKPLGVVIEITKSPMWLNPLAECLDVPVPLVPVTVTE